MNRYWNPNESTWNMDQNWFTISSLRKLDSDLVCSHKHDAQQMRVTRTRTISCATASGTSFSRSKVNSMAPPSLYLPFSLRGSSTHSFSAMEVFIPSSSSASSTLTPVSSAKKAWFSRSLMEYLWRESDGYWTDEDWVRESIVSAEPSGNYDL